MDLRDELISSPVMIVQVRSHSSRFGMFPVFPEPGKGERASVFHGDREGQLRSSRFTPFVCLSAAIIEYYDGLVVGLKSRLVKSIDLIFPEGAAAPHTIIRLRRAANIWALDQTWEKIWTGVPVFIAAICVIVVEFYSGRERGAGEAIKSSISWGWIEILSFLGPILGSFFIASFFYYGWYEFWRQTRIFGMPAIIRLLIGALPGPAIVASALVSPTVPVPSEKLWLWGIILGPVISGLIASIYLLCATAISHSAAAGVTDGSAIGLSVVRSGS
jgi:hypothetical protein